MLRILEMLHFLKEKEGLDPSSHLNLKDHLLSKICSLTSLLFKNILSIRYTFISSVSIHKALYALHAQLVYETIMA